MNSFSKLAMVVLATLAFIAATRITVAAADFGLQKGPIVFDSQNNLWIQGITVTNTSAVTFSAVRVYVDGLPMSVRLHNASGTNSGRVYIQSPWQLSPNETGSLVLAFHNSGRSTFTNTLEVVPILPAASPVLSFLTFTNNQCSFVIIGSVGSNYVVEGTTNLSSPNWIQLCTNSAPFTFVETNENFVQRFYRGLLTP